MAPTRPPTTMAKADGVADIFSEVYGAAKAKYNLPSSSQIKTYTKSFTPPAIATASAGPSHSVDELVALLAKWSISISTGSQPERASIHSLPRELAPPIFWNLEDDTESLMAARLVCRDFYDLASPVLLKSVCFYRHPESWQELHDLCNSPQLAKHVKHLEIGKLPKYRVKAHWKDFPLPPEGFQDLKIESLKICDYRYFLDGDVRVPVATQFLTTLHIDTTCWMLLEDLRDKPTDLRFYAWNKGYCLDEFISLQNLTITQDPTRVRICQPAWDSGELFYLDMDHAKEMINKFKEDDMISFELTEPSAHDRATYSEEEPSFMVDNDMLPDHFRKHPVRLVQQRRCEPVP
ncbi:MAG: hypothetical protein Q9181_007973 [Wetmoreana brouardii]